MAWAATELSATAICRLLRISWRTVGAIVERVVAAAWRAPAIGWRGCSGSASTSCRSATGSATSWWSSITTAGGWCGLAPGRDAATVDAFFAELGAERTARLTHVAVDMGSWLHRSLRRRLAPSTRVCVDPFHVVQLAQEALHDVRREVWNAARRGGDRRGARWLKGARFALFKRADRLTDRQAATLAEIAELNEPLYRAYLLKEQLRLVIHEHQPAACAAQFDQWLEDAEQSDLAPFVRTARSLAGHRAEILEAISERVTNARTEATNTTLRLIVRRAYGFHSAAPMIALAMLKLGGHRPPLPTTA